MPPAPGLRASVSLAPTIPCPAKPRLEVIELPAEGPPPAQGLMAPNIQLATPPPQHPLTIPHSAQAGPFVRTHDGSKGSRPLPAQLWGQMPGLGVPCRVGGETSVICPLHAWGPAPLPWSLPSLSLFPPLPLIFIHHLSAWPNLSPCSPQRGWGAPVRGWDTAPVLAFQHLPCQLLSPSGVKGADMTQAGSCPQLLAESWGRGRPRLR